MTEPIVVEANATVRRIIIIIILAGLGWFAFRSYAPVDDTGVEMNTVADHKNATYVIEGAQVTLVNGVAETPAAPDSTSMTTTRYFGNELKTDLNGDGREDIAFILTQDAGGSGTFYYAVAALNTSNGYVGSDGYLLGDRIAPQSTTVSPDANQKYVVVFNYADRAQGDPMTAQPSVGKSVYLKLDSESMRWGVVLSPEERTSL